MDRARDSQWSTWRGVARRAVLLGAENTPVARRVLVLWALVATFAGAALSSLLERMSRRIDTKLLHHNELVTEAVGSLVRLLQGSMSFVVAFSWVDVARE